MNLNPKASRSTFTLPTDPKADAHLYVSREFAGMLRRRKVANAVRYGVQWLAAIVLVGLAVLVCGGIAVAGYGVIIYTLAAVSGL